MSCQILVLAATVAGALEESPTENGGFLRLLGSSIAFLPEYSVDADLRYYLFQKNDYFREHYYLENSVNLRFSLFSFRKEFHWAGELHFLHSMGQSPGNIVFDPIDIGYGLLLAVEYRHPSVILYTGLAHNCAHQIDRQDLKTVYYNNPVVAAGSLNFRQADYRNNLLARTTWTFYDRFSWHCRAGWYLRSFFGLASPGKLNGVNPYLGELQGEFRYCFFASRSWLFDVKNSVTVGYHTDVSDNAAGSGVGWKNYSAIEAMTRRSKKGAMLFLAYGFDDLPMYPSMDGSYFVPRFSYDRMLQVGLRFFM